MLYAEEQGREGDGKALAAAVGDPELTDEAVDLVRQVLVDVGAVAEVERRIEELADSGWPLCTARPLRTRPPTG